VREGTLNTDQFRSPGIARTVALIQPVGKDEARDFILRVFADRGQESEVFGHGVRSFPFR
jgi:hypothetical protein